MNNSLTTYMINISENAFIECPILNQTTLAKVFTGQLVNNENGKFYFKDNSNPDTLIIIPYKWIEWMAPLDGLATTK